MYTREILPPIASPIVDGKPVIGTWTQAFENVNLQDIRKPYKHSLPRWLRENRIKEWQCFDIQDDSYILEAFFCNLKYYRMAQVLLYNKNTNEKFVFRKIKPGTGWHLPQGLANSYVDYHASQFYFRIHCWLDADTINLGINIEGIKKQPSLTVHLAYNVNREITTPMVVSLSFSEHRMMYAYKVLAPVHGDMVFGGKRISLKQDTCSGFFTDFKGYFPYQMITTSCYGMGFNNENKRFGFNIAENQTREKNKNNENALWVDGKLTLLPPVIITMPDGPDETWVIQDVEGMVDLTFTPKELNRCGTNLLFTKADFITPLGVYNGILVNSEGEKIQIKNLSGIGEKLLLRL